MEELIKEIKKKKEYRYIDDSLIRNVLEYVLEKGEIKDERELIKKIRKLLHETVGTYEVLNKDYIFSEFFEKLDKSNITKYDIYKILSLSWSTRERMYYYERIYKEIFSVTNKDEITILDMACGLNPFSIFFIPKKVKLYVAFDVSHNIVNWVNRLLTKVNQGYAFVFNLLSGVNQELTEINWNFVFLWKTVPLIEKIKKGITKEFLQNLNYEFFVISFSKKTLGLRRYRQKDWNNWISKITKDLNLKIVKIFEIPNEKFYIIKKGF